MVNGPKATHPARVRPPLTAISQEETQATNGQPHRWEEVYTPKLALSARSKLKLMPRAKTHCVSLCSSTAQEGSRGRHPSGARPNGRTTYALTRFVSFSVFPSTAAPTFSLRSNAATSTHSPVICPVAALEAQAESVDCCPSALRRLTYF